MQYFEHECGSSWNKPTKTKLKFLETKPHQPSTSDSTSQLDINNHHQISLYPSFPGLQIVCSQKNLGLVTQPIVVTWRLSVCPTMSIGLVTQPVKGLRAFFQTRILVLGTQPKLFQGS